MGLEEKQAYIYNKHLEKFPKTAFIAVTAENIKKRLIFEKKDPKGILYALKEDGTPLSYIQTTINESPPKTWLGYPWAVEECPIEVQEKLYNDMLLYVKKKYPDNEIVMGYLSESWYNQIKFAKDKGYQQSDQASFYIIETEKIDFIPDSKYSSRIANLDDLDILVELMKSDKDFEEEFSNDDEIVNYLKNRVFRDGGCVLVFKEEELVCSSAPLKGFYRGVMFRFTAIRPGFEDSWKNLVIEMGNQVKKMGWKEPLIFTSFDKWEIIEPMIKELGAKHIDTQILFKLID
ncbi:MAG: hypothetical protein GY870_05935 [archaeon]|nr:hypothetical protein [archaeon]